MSVLSRLRSFRVQLAVAGFAAIYLTVLVLFGVTYVTDDETVTTEDGVAVYAHSADHGLGPSGVAVILLAPVAAALAWWWAGRAVRPIERIRVVAEGIEAADLGSRLALRTGPTEIVRVASSFDAMLDRLRDAALLQRDVLDEISHELRTPIAVLIANADVRLANDGPTTEWLRDGLEQSRRTAGRMGHILERLLVDARGQARSIDRHPADLIELVRGVVEEMEAVGADRHVAVQLTGRDRLVGPWDMAMVAQAVTNVLDNAVRHSPPDSSVDVRITADDGLVRIAVSDHGPGIPSEQQDAVFERSWQGRDDGSGHGLGLAIARQVARSHGGDVTLCSPDSAGYSTTFVVSLAGLR
jgi:signal transduction histidine kinase